MTESVPDQIPLIDLDRWRQGNPAQRQQVVEEVDFHLQRLGFLMVRNHGIDAAVRDAARQAALAFFALDTAQKQIYGGPEDAYRGWIAPGLESNASSYADNSGEVIVDLKEAFSVGPVFQGVDACAKKSARWYAPNIWPESHVAGFEKALTDWWFAADRLTQELLQLLSRALGLGRHWVNESCMRPMATVTTNLYPAVVEGGGWRVGAHTDFGTITVLDRDTDNGLQVEVEPGHWIEAPRIEDALTINLGEMMVLLSGQRWKANPHRVAARVGAAVNLSLIYFHDPNHDLELPAQHEDGRVMTAADFLGVKMDQIMQSSEPASGGRTA